MKNSKNFDGDLFEKIFDLNSKNKIGANTIAVFTFILYKCEDLQKEIVLSDYQMASELGLSRQTIITSKNKLKLLGILDYSRNRGFPNRFILKGNELQKTASKNAEIKEISIEDFNKMANNSDKHSCNELDILTNGAIKVQGLKKRTRYTWDIDSLLDVIAEK